MGVLFAATLTAQTPPPTSGTPTTTPAQPSTAAAGTMVTVEGCVTREADVAGRKPNMAERAGMNEGYVLTDVKMVKGTSPIGGADRGTAATAASPRTTRSAPGAPGTPETPSTTGVPGTTGSPGTPTTGMSAAQGAMGTTYGIKGLDGNRLKQHLNQRVQLDGSFENQAGPRAGAEGSGDLLGINATAIRQVSGQCGTHK